MEIDFFLMKYNYTILIGGKTEAPDQKHEPNVWALTVIYYGSRANFRIKSHKKNWIVEDHFMFLVFRDLKLINMQLMFWHNYRELNWF